MQPCSREMQGINNINPQISLQDLHQNTTNNNTNTNTNNTNSSSFDPSSSSTDDFIEQMLSTLPSSWPSTTTTTTTTNELLKSPNNWLDESVLHHAFDEASLLASKLRNHQISNGVGVGGASDLAAKLMMQQQLLMAAAVASSRATDVVVDASPFTHQGGEAMFNGFGSGSIHCGGVGQSQQHFHHSQVGMTQAQNYVGGSGGGSLMMTTQPPPPLQQAASGSISSGGGGAPGQPKQRVRARRGHATDPHSIAERLRRERIAERMKALQELVPNANKTDKASMLDEIIDYVKFLQLQVKVLSMSRLGGAAAVAPLVADMSSEGGGDCVQTGANGGSQRSTPNGNQTASNNDNLTMTEHQVAKLMEEDMGQAMQYLQGKGLCLMPISLATAISTATCHNRSPPIGNNNIHNHPSLQSNGAEGPSSPSMSVLTVQSATMGNGVAGNNGATVKDAASVSKP